MCRDQAGLGADRAASAPPPNLLTLPAPPVISPTPHLLPVSQGSCSLPLLTPRARPSLTSSLAPSLLLQKPPPCPPLRYTPSPMPSLQAGSPSSSSMTPLQPLSSGEADVRGSGVSPDAARQEKGLGHPQVTYRSLLERSAAEVEHGWLPGRRRRADWLQGLFNLPIMRVQRFHPNPSYLVTKRLFDIVLSLLALIILSPVFLITAIAIKCQSAINIEFSMTLASFLTPIHFY